MKWISAGRTELGDPTDPVAASNSKRIRQLQSKSYAEAVRVNISADTTYSWEHYHPAYEPVDPKGTSHLSVLDNYGNAVALTTTVNLHWGAKVHDPQTGIVLNSEMDDFSIPGRSNAYHLEPSIYNYIIPHKRPLSSTTPTIIVEEDGTPGLVIGGSGGSRIVTGVFQAIVKNYLWGYSLLDTIKSPRLHHQLIPEVVLAESNTEEWILEGLKERGHAIKLRDLGEASGGSVIQVVKGMDSGRVEAVADWWRKGGVSFFLLLLFSFFFPSSSLAPFRLCFPPPSYRLITLFTWTSLGLPFLLCPFWHNGRSDRAGCVQQRAAGY